MLIESADPGYDWIFSHEIKGLITKFGGINSHMAIRCAEFNLPAAIGCGDKLFNQIKNQKNILLDCSEKKFYYQILIFNDKKEYNCNFFR